MPTDLNIGMSPPPVSRKNESWHVTSEELIEALGPIGQEYVRPSRYASKIDLSHTTAFAAFQDSAQASEEAAVNAACAADKREKQRNLINLKGVFVQYLRRLEPHLSMNGRRVIGGADDPQIDQAMLDLSRGWRWLNIFGWDITDLMNWTWILKAESAELAAVRLSLVAERFPQKTYWGAAVPLTIYLFLLRRQNMTARGLRILLSHAWELLNGASRSLPVGCLEKDDSFRKVIPSPREHPAGIDEDIFIMIVIRLLRQARRVWPAACESIISLFCKYLNGLNFYRENSQDPARLSFVYNTILKLLAVPASIEPFVSATHQQRAQFVALRRMNQFNPPLVVDKAGYRAITQLQLMHKKTGREREWAVLKSKSWPPWKEDRLGTDAAIGPEYGVSRAKEVLKRAEEAGYSSETWEQAASVLSGWDTDGTPTIQSRRVFSSTCFSDYSTHDEHMIWANRIRATRTLNEAWALFQGYRDERRRHSGVVYQALFEKLIFDKKRREKEESQCPANPNLPDGLPGDGLEVYPEPIPLQAVYVRTKPPTIEELLNLMVNHGIRPNGRILQKLLMHAPSFSFGIKALLASSLNRQYKAILLGEPKQAAAVTDVEHSLHSVAKYIFHAFIGFLTRFMPTSHEDDNHDLSSDIHVPTDVPLSSTLLQNPLNHAFRLMRLRKPKERMPWIQLLSALSRSHGLLDKSIPTFRRSQLDQDILSWHAIVRLLKYMDELNVSLDLDAFMCVCVGLEKAIIASERFLATHSRAQHDSSLHQAAEAVLNDGLSTVKIIFKDIVHVEPASTDPSQSLLDWTPTDDTPAPNSDSTPTTTEDAPTDDDDPTNPSPKPPQFLSPTYLLPHLLATPRPAHLHAFIRVLGLSRDYDGLLSLLDWTSLHYPTLHAHLSELANGPRMFRRCIIATRVFLERSWNNDIDIPEREKHVLLEDDQHVRRRRRGSGDEEGGIGGEGVAAAPMEMCLAVRQVVEEQGEQWGGWPSDGECEEYVLKGRFL